MTRNEGSVWVYIEGSVMMNEEYQSEEKKSQLFRDLAK